MCGFTGIFHRTVPVSYLDQTIRSMTSTLARRGPDAEGFFIGDGVALGHRRLSILDLSPAGAQPMSLSEAGITIAFNGEVYNFLQLRRELEGLGRSFKGRSDTEVMLNAYAEWGLAGLRRFEGIFAFSIWDPANQRLILMRDRLGAKPLFYSQNGERLIFGSEIKSLFAAGGVNATVDQQAFSEYLWYGNGYEDRTIFRSIRALLPGHWLIAERGSIRIEPWWRLEEWSDAPAFSGGKREATLAVREAVDGAVKRQLVSDVPVGILLSGGIDSSAIAASAVRAHSKRLSSYCVGFDFDRGINELPKARRVADHLGLDHHEFHVNGSSIGDILVELARAHDEPFADAANIPLFLLARQLKGDIKVVLQGDGGDEMFAGYRRHSILRNAALWKMWPQTITPLIRRAFGISGHRFARMAEAVGMADPAMQMALLLTNESLYDPPDFLLNVDSQEALRAEADPFLAYRKCAQRFKGADAVQRMLLTDITLQLPSQFLTKVDRSTMACGLEARVPLLDEMICRLVVNFPTAWKVNRNGKKVILRNALRGRIPDDILDGPKTGFGVPYEYWLRSSLYELARDSVLEERFLARFGFNRNKLERAFDEHRNQIRNRGFVLWKIFQLAIWDKAIP